MASMWERWSRDASNAFQDVYGNLVLGDDAGDSAKLVVVVKSSAPATVSPLVHPNLPPHPTAANMSTLGVTFCEINGRAYVQSVEQGSRADLAGVQPRDCVQYAAVLAREWKDPLGEDSEEIQKHALEREESGQRISYKELKDLLQTGVLEFYGNNHNSAGVGEGLLSPQQPSVPTTIRVSGTYPCGPLNSTTSSASKANAQFGVEPPAGYNKDKDNNSNSNSNNNHAGNEDASEATRSLKQHDKNNKPEPVHTTSNQNEPRPVVLVFRRTKQWPSQSIPIWPHFRLDDECDVACQILRSLAISPSAESNRGETPGDAGVSEAGPGCHAADETVEVATIRAMIQKAVGLAFLRSNRFVLGVSVHAGSGIVLSRLADGTWSAPSAIGIAGAGVGLQMGFEVAHSVLILQTKEALEHFQRGGSFTVGANVGAAVGAMGREASGAASLSGALCGHSPHYASMVLVKDDEYHADTQSLHAQSSVGVAPLVAYAKSQGLYVGVSLEGSRIHSRDEVNARTYQFDTRKAVTAHDLLTGKVAPPQEAEALYQALHQVEFAHELQSLPRPPKQLWATGKPWLATDEPLDLPGEESLGSFEAKFRELLFGGVHVWRCRGRKRERRTLWLYVPEGSASLQLGFVSKLANGVEAKRTGSTETTGDDRRSVASEEVTLDSALMDNQSVLNPQQSVRMQVELSRKHTVHLTEVVRMTQTTPADIIFDDPAESRRVVCLETAFDQQLLFVAKSDLETHVLLSGLKLLLESESKRCGIRGGLGKTGAAPTNGRSNNKKHRRKSTSGYASSEVEDNDDQSACISIGEMPEGWRSWGRVPGRNYLRGQASANDQGYPQYVHGQLLVRDIAKNVHLPLPLPLCRVLLLDSSSPVISQWEKDRGDVEFEKTPWNFPPATPREGDHYQSEHQLIASGSMCGAHRTISYQRPRNGQMVRLFETQIVDSDDSEKLAFQIHERMPRRGFSIKVKIFLRAYNNECEATVLGEIRPVGKNMSNPEAVHKAFLLVVDELRHRYGPEGHGLLSGFLNAVSTFKESDLPPHINKSLAKSGAVFGEEKKEAEQHTKPATVPAEDAASKSIKLEDMLKSSASLGVVDAPEPKFLQDRPSTPSPMDVDKYREAYRKPKNPAANVPSSDSFGESNEPVMIEVKPLPKIRLSLMPSPREEDEDNLNDEESSGKRSSRSKKSSRTSSSGGTKTTKRWGKKRRSKSRSKSKSASPSKT